MRWKLTALIAALMLVVTTVTPARKIEAQGLVEYALILVLVSIATDEVLELYGSPGHGAGLPVPLPPGLSPTIFITYQPKATLPDTPICRQSVQMAEPMAPDLNILRVQIGAGNDSLLINGEYVSSLDSCFSTARRVSLALGVLKPLPAKNDQAHGSSVEDRVGLPNLARDFPSGYSVVSPDGFTLATSGGASHPPGYFLHKDLQGSTNFVTGTGNGETAEIHLRSWSSQGGGHRTHDPLIDFTFTIEVTNTGDVNCTQTIEKVPLEATLFGLPMLRVSKGFGFITRDDGEQIELEDECFKDPQNQRVALALRDLSQTTIAEDEAADQGFDSEFGVQFARYFSVVGYSIEKLDGSTAASAQYPHGPAGVFTIDATFTNISSDSF